MRQERFPELVEVPLLHARSLIHEKFELLGLADRYLLDGLKQLITGSTGLDDWEWGVTLMAHQTDAVKEIVYEMRFDEVSARYGGFGEFYINLRLQAADLWEHLRL